MAMIKNLNGSHRGAGRVTTKKNPLILAYSFCQKKLGLKKIGHLEKKNKGKIERSWNDQGNVFLYSEGNKCSNTQSQKKGTQSHFSQAAIIFESDAYPSTNFYMFFSTFKGSSFFLSLRPQRLFLSFQTCQQIFHGFM